MIATASPGKHDTVRALGVDEVLDSARPDLAEEITRLTGGVDLVNIPVTPVTPVMPSCPSRRHARHAVMPVTPVMSVRTAPPRSWRRTHAYAREERFVGHGPRRALCASRPTAAAAGSAA
ncbi:hypothetical protein ACFWDQ_33020 [Streptomyces sp. NPDC060053]|uniref:hypothetical protein n=1 Tax=Streptomyces sp. NPDC060053 TaxID=3347047 RepID=UPI003691ED2B